MTTAAGVALGVAVGVAVGVGVTVAVGVGVAVTVVVGVTVGVGLTVWAKETGVMAHSPSMETPAAMFLMFMKSPPL